MGSPFFRTGHRALRFQFFQPYSADKLVHASYQLIASGLKQLNKEAVRPCSLVVFASLYRNSDLLVTGRRYLYPVVVD